MENNIIRDTITVEDDMGIEKNFSVEALFDMEEQTYAILKAEDDADDTIIMQVENDEDRQYLVGINDPHKKSMILDAYEIAVDANPAD